MFVLVVLFAAVEGARNIDSICLLELNTCSQSVVPSYTQVKDHVSFIESKDLCYSAAICNLSHCLWLVFHQQVIKEGHIDSDQHQTQP